MSDLAVTCPRDFFAQWIAEGDAAGELPSGQEYAWFLGGKKPPIEPGERLYVFANGLLRGYAPVTRVAKTERGWAICREGGAVAVTLPSGTRRRLPDVHRSQVRKARPA
ncbi:MAG: hypothetical protein A3E01_02975 [Gammaproteobacteria bacterium RIFCSPHIGHO2_12_FULL_63_22]|nr:MAG: hypothetical protein A3E01_02975 [Gammaproteobacteria bacterium RIFCSPHIGHO2_12_FULL_63_22]